MAEETRLPSFEEFMEQMCSVKPKELTPEEKEHLYRLIEQTRQKKRIMKEEQSI